MNMNDLHSSPPKTRDLLLKMTTTSTVNMNNDEEYGEHDKCSKSGGHLRFLFPSVHVQGKWRRGFKDASEIECAEIA